MTEFKYFTRLPPEIRNSIYELLLVDRHIEITSPRNRRKKTLPRTNFGSLLRVNKQIHAEAKTIFYARNTFIVGNGRWGSRAEANLQALKAFTSRVPKSCIALITKVEIDMYFQLHRYWGALWGQISFFMHENDALDLQCVARALLKYFTGVEYIGVVAALEDRQKLFADDPRAELRGDVDGAVKAVVMMLGVPNLRRMCFRSGSNVDFDPFFEKVINNNEEKKDMVFLHPYPTSQ